MSNSLEKLMALNDSYSVARSKLKVYDPKLVKYYDKAFVVAFVSLNIDKMCGDPVIGAHIANVVADFLNKLAHHITLVCGVLERKVYTTRRWIVGEAYSVIKLAERNPIMFKNHVDWTDLFDTIQALLDRLERY